MANFDDLFQRLEELNAIGVALSRERNLDRLLEKILAAAKGITNADAGTVYLMTKTECSLAGAETGSVGMGLSKR